MGLKIEPRFQRLLWCKKTCESSVAKLINCWIFVDLRGLFYKSDNAHILVSLLSHKSGFYSGHDMSFRWQGIFSREYSTVWTSSIEHLSLVSAQLKALFELYKRECRRIQTCSSAHSFFRGLNGSRIQHQKGFFSMKYAAPLTRFIQAPHSRILFHFL